MKIFCIGLHKTGTVSLETALKKLGYKTRHGYKKHSDIILKAFHQDLPPLQLLEEQIGEHDAYLDLYAVRDHFVALDDVYESKFILTTRGENEWVESVKRQIKKRPNSPFFHHWYYQSEMQWRHFKRMHENAVREYFDVPVTRGIGSYFLSQKLLIMDITKGHGWDELCEFLDKPIPGAPFPHKNKSTKL